MTLLWPAFGFSNPLTSYCLSQARTGPSFYLNSLAGSSDSFIPIPQAPALNLSIFHKRLPWSSDPEKSLSPPPWILPLAEASSSSYVWYDFMFVVYYVSSISPARLVSIHKDKRHICSVRHAVFCALHYSTSSLLKADKELHSSAPPFSHLYNRDSNNPGSLLSRSWAQSLHKVGTR